jgi:hypothetical protein
MKIFLSWSGSRSRAVAKALNDWLPRVIQALKPFYSPEIEKGAKWSGELDDALEGTRFGIVCLTPDCLNSPWIHFESGALSKTKDAAVWTYLYDLNAGDVPQPLGKFQHTSAERNDTFRLLKSINQRLADSGGEPLDEQLLRESFETFWPKLDEQLQQVNELSIAKQSSSTSHTRQRDERAILNEILELVRNQDRRLIALERFETKTELIQPEKSRTLLFTVPDTWSFADIRGFLNEFTSCYHHLGTSKNTREGITTLRFHFQTSDSTEKIGETVFSVAASQGLKVGAFSLS